MQILLNILFIYIALYSVYFFILALRNLNDRKFRIERKYNEFTYQNELCLIIYSHNNEATLENLVKQLKQQNYPEEKFTTYIILDNCSDNSEFLFANDNFVKVFAIKDQETVGKDQAISILIERLSATQNFNAYVFLDANRYVEKDFLNSINSALINNPVISGSTVLIADKMNLRKNIKNTFHKYYTNFIQKSRALLGLSSIVDSDILIIRQDIMEKIGCIDFQNINTELKYSLLLSKIGCGCKFNPNIKTYINVDDFNLRIPSLSTRLSLFFNCFTQLFTSNLKFNEHVYSLLYPNFWLIVLSYAYLLQHSYKYYFIVDFSVVVICFVLLILGFSISLLNTLITTKELGYLFLYPIYSLGHIAKNLPLCRQIRRKLRNEPVVKSKDKLKLDVFVTDGKINIPCKLELISESGLAKVKFIFKKKKFTTSTHLRMVDAIKEITTKLDDYGFVLKICQSCAHFTNSVDGSTNMIKGLCHCQFAGQQNINGLPTLIWNSCRGFIPKEFNNLIQEIAN